MLPVIEEARNTFPDAANDSQALTRALFHWYHNRQENSKRGALARLESEVAQLAKRLTNVEDELADMKMMLRQLLGHDQRR
jgi:hypothetical protein